MLPVKLLRTAALMVLALVFCLGVTHLFTLRFRAGDIYPAYSSLRSDPLGCRALYESLSALEQIRVSRHYRGLDRIQSPETSVLFFLGLTGKDRMSLPRNGGEQIRTLVEGGATLVISLAQDGTDASGTAADPKGSAAPQAAGKNPEPARPDPGKEQARPRICPGARTDLLAEFGLSLGHCGPARGRIPAEYGPGLAPPADTPLLFWPCHRYFRLSVPGQWQTLVKAGGQPVVVARKMGKGRLIFSADAYVFSNEALGKAPASVLIADLVGIKKKVVFDEYHLGVRKEIGIAGLMRRYGLSLPMLLAGGFGLLLAWRSGTRFMPPDPGFETAVLEKAGVIRPSRASWDRGSSPGLNSLLSRHLPESRLAAACVAAWKESRLSFGRVNRLPDPETMDRIQALVSDPALKNNPVKAYNQIDEQVSKQ